MRSHACYCTAYELSSASVRRSALQWGKSPPFLLQSSHKFHPHPQSDSYEPSYRFILAITRVRVVPSTRYRQSDGNQHGWLSAPNYTDRTTSSPLSHNLEPRLRYHSAVCISTDRPSVPHPPSYTHTNHGTERQDKTLQDLTGDNETKTGYPTQRP